MNSDSIMKQQERVKGVIKTCATSMIGIAIIESCVRRNVPVLAVVRENTKRIKVLIWEIWISSYIGKDF